MSSFIMARGGVGIAQISSMPVMVGIWLERIFCNASNDPFMTQAAAGRQNFKKSMTDRLLPGRITCCILGGI
jgi:hypothetical protein